MIITQKEIDALEKYLRWTLGLESSSAAEVIRETYRQHENFTDEEYEDVAHILNNLVKRARGKSHMLGIW